MSALDTIASVAVGGYLIAVGYQGNGSALIEQVKVDKAFIKWALAVGIALYLYRIPGMSEPVTLIIAMAFIGLFLQNGTRIAEGATAFWKSLDEATS